jgi:hypothetical protein
VAVVLIKLGGTLRNLNSEVKRVPLWRSVVLGKQAEFSNMG